MTTSIQTESPKPPQTEHKIDLTSSDIANIWQAYMNDSMAICTIGIFLSHI